MVQKSKRVFYAVPENIFGLCLFSLDDYYDIRRMMRQGRIYDAIFKERR